MKLDDKGALAITRAQNLLSAVRQLHPNIKALEGSELLKLLPDEAISYAMWLLGTKIPRAARAERTAEAWSKLALAQGLLLGAGAFSRHDTHLCTACPPTGQRQRGNFGPFISLTV